MVMDVLAVVVGVFALAGGGFVGWRLGVSSKAQVEKVVSDVKAGQIGDAVKDAQTPKA